MATSLKRSLGRVSLRIRMKVGEIYWTRLASRGGREQAGRRPSIILQKDTNLPTVLLVPLTTQQDALRFSGTVLIEPDSENNLPNISVALVFQLTALDKHSLERKIGKISKQNLEEIWEAFDEITGRN
jgi:mRNA-degrading endonuclease toxin of MazEF toxin-antitoxin module